jgi:hypothetical protein
MLQLTQTTTSTNTARESTWFKRIYRLPTGGVLLGVVRVVSCEEGISFLRSKAVFCSCCTKAVRAS